MVYLISIFIMCTNYLVCQIQSSKLYSRWRNANCTLFKIKCPELWTAFHVQVPWWCSILVIGGFQLMVGGFISKIQCNSCPHFKKEEFLVSCFSNSGWLVRISFFLLRLNIQIIDKFQSQSFKNCFSLCSIPILNVKMHFKLIHMCNLYSISC